MHSKEFETEFNSMQDAFDSLAPELEVTVRDPALGVEGYVVVWNTAPGFRGPLGACAKGGTRITPEVTLDEIRMLARQMAMKNAAANLAFGGAKSGLKANPDAPGFEKKYRRFVQLVKPLLKENGGVWGGFGFDIGARPEHPLWACDELRSTKSFTGKPLELGGTDYDKEGIAGLGVSVAAVELLSFYKEDPKTIRYAIQGIGAMGSAVFRYFSECGAQVSYIADPRLGGCVVFDRPPSNELADALKFGRIESAADAIREAGYAVIPVEEVLYQAVDVLFPCAVHDVILRENVERVSARYVVEGANNPCSDEARTKLHERGCVVVPGYIANTGGIIAAYVEMTSNLTPEENAKTRGNVERAKESTREKIRDNVRTMLQLAVEAGVEPARAGKFLALKAILNTAPL